MKIRLSVSRATADGVNNVPGDDIEVSDDEGVRLVESGQGEPADKKAYEKARQAYAEKLEQMQQEGAQAAAAEQALALRQQADALMRQADEIDPVGAKD